jgi:Xaa-Pro aminopeptidase
MTPLCRKLIDTSLLTPAEIEWLNVYHAEILEKTRVFFEGHEDEQKRRALEWLKRETQKI